MNLNVDFSYTFKEVSDFNAQDPHKDQATSQSQYLSESPTDK
jgi:hypothetical protein